MRLLYMCVLILLTGLNTRAVAVTAIANSNPELKSLVAGFSPETARMSIDEFLRLTPKKYREMTGKRLGLKKTLELKAAQKMIRKKLGDDEDISKGLYVLLAILGFGWLAMGLLDDWDGSDWIINLVLTLLCWLPGLIHALVKMSKYYP